MRLREEASETVGDEVEGRISGAKGGMERGGEEERRSGGVEEGGFEDMAGSDKRGEERGLTKRKGGEGEEGEEEEGENKKGFRVECRQRRGKGARAFGKGSMKRNEQK